MFKVEYTNVGKAPALTNAVLTNFSYQSFEFLEGTITPACWLPGNRRSRVANAGI